MRCDTIEALCAYLDSRGVKYTRDGDKISAGGDLDLSRLTTLPAGVTISAGVALDLDNLTSLPEGVTLSAGATLYLGSLTNEEQTYQGQTIRLRTIDYILTRLIHSREIGDVTLWSAQYFKGHLDTDLRCYVAQQGDTYAHGETAERALLDLRFKLAQENFDANELVDEIKRRGTVTRWDYRLLTGACEAGLKDGLHNLGLDPDLAEMPLEMALTLCTGRYGGDMFRKLMGAQG